MSLFNRLRRLFSANVYELIERVEEPTVLLKQSLRDIDRQVAETLDTAVRVTAEEKLIARQIAQQERQIVQCTTTARTAVANGDDDDARAALWERGHHRHVVDTLSAEAASVNAAASRLRDHLDHLHSRRREAQARVTALVARQRAAAASQRAVQELTGDGENSALSAFDNLAERVERNELELSARIELTRTNRPSAREVDPDIERELAELKSQTALNSEGQGLVDSERN